MMTLYVKDNCPACEEVREKIEEMVLAHDVVNIDEAGTESPLRREELPLIEDEGKTYSGNEAIEQYFEDLEKYHEEWYKFQSDVCYVDDDGNVICSA